MPSDVRYLPVVRGVVGPLAAAKGWDEPDCLRITLALDEALANIIRHAYHNRTDGMIELEVKEYDDGLEFTLTDQGDAPDLTKICSREPGCDTPGGLGTHIIRDVMDHVSYRRLSGGNCFVATKKLRTNP